MKTKGTIEVGLICKSNAHLDFSSESTDNLHCTEMLEQFISPTINHGTIMSEHGFFAGSVTPEMEENMEEIWEDEDMFSQDFWV